MVHGSERIMSVPKELMDLISGGGGQKPPAGFVPPSAPTSSPMSAPMTTPQPKEGEMQAAEINITMAMDLLEQSLQAFGSTSEEGSAILNSLKTLSNKFGKNRQKADSLVPTEIQQLLASLPQAGGASPVQKALQGAPQQPPAAPQMPAGIPM